jgi:hypothetical protein
VNKVPRYQPLYDCLWTDPDFADCGANVLLLYIWTWSNPHIDDLGITRARVSLIAEETHLDRRVVTRGLEKLTNMHKIVWDREANLIGNYAYLWRRHGRASPKMLSGIVHALTNMSPDGSVVCALIEKNKSVLISLYDRYHAKLSDFERSQFCAFMHARAPNLNLNLNPNLNQNLGKPDNDVVDNSSSKPSDTPEAPSAKKGAPMPPECREQLSKIFEPAEETPPDDSTTLPWEQERPKDPHAEAERLREHARRLEEGDSS